MSKITGSDALVIAALAAGGYSLYKAMEEPTAVAGKPAPPPKPTSQKKPNLPVLNPPTNNPPSNNTINNNNIINNIINPPVSNPPANNPPVNNPPANNPPVNNPPVNNPPVNNPPANNPPVNNPPVMRSFTNPLEVTVFWPGSTNNVPSTVAASSGWNETHASAIWDDIHWLIIRGAGCSMYLDQNADGNHETYLNFPGKGFGIWPVDKKITFEMPRMFSEIGVSIEPDDSTLNVFLNGKGPQFNVMVQGSMRFIFNTTCFMREDPRRPGVYNQLHCYVTEIPNGHERTTYHWKNVDGSYISISNRLDPHHFGSTLKKSKPQLMKLYRNEFPDLTVEVVERFTNSFNCIAWTIGVRDRWVWNEIDTNGDGLSSFSEFVSFYGRHGLLPTTVESEADVAIFGFESFGKLDVKHGAVREKGSNYWLSKMGQGGIIRHEGLNVFDTSPYGKLLLMFKRV